MIVGTGLHIVSMDCNSNQTLYSINDMVTIKRRNYLAELGYVEYIGRISSILVNTSELRLDISQTSDSKYVTIGFGEIIEIEKYVKPGEEPADDDVAVFDVKTKRMIMETIPAMLQEILTKLAFIQTNCEKCQEHRTETN